MKQQQQPCCNIYKANRILINSMSSLVSQSTLLQTFYNTTGGSIWTTPNNWFVEGAADVCFFDGVTCDLFGNVAALELSNFGLNGYIPTELCLMSKLTKLDLGYNNNLIGSIPSEVGLLSALEWLDFAYTSISGPIPSELGLLDQNMQFLFVANTDITGSIPSELGLLTSLYQLWLFHNHDLSGSMPSEFSNLMLLNQLLMHHNYAMSGSTIPTEFAYLTSMQYLNLGTSNFSSTIPSQVSKYQYTTRITVRAWFLY